MVSLQEARSLCLPLYSDAPFFSNLLRLTEGWRARIIFCVISGFHREVGENRALLGS